MADNSNFDFTQKDEYIIITKYHGSASEVIIPDKIDGLPVCVIGESAFTHCKSLTSVSIPEGVTTIGNRAFAGCRSLTSVSIPESVTTIGNWAFDSCTPLTSVTIPEGVT